MADTKLAGRLHQAAYEETGHWGRKAAGCLVLAKSTGRILVAYRSNEVLEPHTWGTWGGAIDPGEDPKKAALREIREEAGRIEFEEFLPMMIFIKGSFHYHNFLAIVADEFSPKLDAETQNFLWCHEGQWPSPLHPGMKTLLGNAESLALMRLKASEARSPASPRRNPKAAPAS